MDGMIQVMEDSNGFLVKAQHLHRILDLAQTTPQVRNNRNCLVMAEIICRDCCHLSFMVFHHITTQP